MKTAATVLMVLAVIALALTAVPTLAEEPGSAEEDPRPCVTIYQYPPGVLVDPSCLDHHLPPIPPPM